jgi:hypothetical protein
VRVVKCRAGVTQGIVEIHLLGEVLQEGTCKNVVIYPEFGSVQKSSTFSLHFCQFHLPFEKLPCSSRTWLASPHGLALPSCSYLDNSLPLPGVSACDWMNCTHTLLTPSQPGASPEQDAVQAVDTTGHTRPLPYCKNSGLDVAA